MAIGARGFGVEVGRGRKRRVRPLAEVLEGRQLLATITVNSTGDADGADGSDTLSLRQAIEISNGNLTVASLTTAQQALVSGALSTPNTIDFDIPGTGPFTIKPGSALPSTTSPVIIDGYSEPGAMANTGGVGQADNATLEIAIDFSGESGGGLQLMSPTNTVEGLAIGGAAGVYNDGIELLSTGFGQEVIQGNFLGFGLNASGPFALPNSGYGVNTGSGANTIGGTTAAARNVISNNTVGGIELTGSGNLVEGNFIGTDLSGAKADPNGAGIALLGGSTNTIGGTAAAAGNVISGNKLDGINLSYVVGDDPMGSGPFIITSDDNAFEGNLIGTDLTGANALSNDGYGISIVAGDGNTIGGTASGAGNVITNNGQAGVGIATANVPQFAGKFYNQGNSILSNSIFGNGGLGIDLGETGIPLVNNPAGSATGPNKLQPYPVFTPSDGLGYLTATLTAAPSTTYTIQVFVSYAATHNGSGQGDYLSTQVVTTNASGVASFDVSNPDQPGISFFIYSMTATDPEGNTSEFTPQVLPVSNPVAPVVAVGASTSSVPQGNSITLIAAVGSNATGQPTGLVGFVVDGTVVGFAPINSQGYATLTFNTGQLAVGAGHTVVAAYQGNPDFTPAFSGSPFQFTVASPETIEIAGSSSITPQGQAITFAAAVRSPGAATPTGLVAFVSDGTDVLGYAPLDANGNATFVTDQITPGGHDTTAVYLGDATHPSLTSLAFGVGIVAGSVSKGPAVTSQVISGSNTVKVSFNQALLQTTAESLANYAIAGPSGQTIAITAAVYDPSTRSVTLVTQQALNPKQTYKLTVKGVRVGGIEDVFGLALNAKSKGGPGSNSVGNIKA